MKPELEPRSTIDTSKMSAGQRAALEMTEAARDQRRNNGFAASLFFGEPDFTKLLPFLRQSLEDRDQGDAFLTRLKHVLNQHADPDEIDRTGEIPDHLLNRLAEIGAFGIKIPVKYGGLGLSQTNYSRAAMMLGGVCGNLTALLSAHQSIGVPQPLLAFGTEEQKEMFLPRCARGEISAFALTEKDVGSDPARMSTTAVPAPDGEHFILNGEKLWCTNGTRASLIVVLAKTSTPDKPNATTAFVVENDRPGVEIVQRCRFMGLRALYNGVIRFKDVMVPKSHIIGGEGKGLKVALTTLNTGRITLPAACAGVAKRCLDISTRWAKRREQWGQAIGKHGAIADKLSRMAAHTFALEALVHYISAQLDKNKHADVRLEAAIGRLWGSERTWEIMDATMQMRGGRGYETAGSQELRGEVPEPVERQFRDSRINTIFEGSSEIMRLFIAREALDPHLKIGAQAVNASLPMKQRMKAALRAAKFYSVWLPVKNVPRSIQGGLDLHPSLLTEMASVERLSRKLARRLFFAMAINGPALEKKQVLLGRFVDIGSELFVLATAIGYAQSKIVQADMNAKQVDHKLALVGYLGQLTRHKVGELFRSIVSNADREGVAIARELTS
ncbi:MAG: acyl-CoA dehydrogenase family protein, partial [Verrucomicrobiaceae bacterium]